MLGHGLHSAVWATVCTVENLRPIHDSPRDWDSFATLNSPAPSAPNVTHTLSVSVTHLALSVCVLVMFIRVISGSLVSPLPLSALSWVQSTARCLSLLWLIMQHQSLIWAEIRYPIQQYCVSVLCYFHQILMLMLHGDNTRVSQFWYFDSSTTVLVICNILRGVGSAELRLRRQWAGMLFCKRAMQLSRDQPWSR